MRTTELQDQLQEALAGTFQSLLQKIGPPEALTELKPLVRHTSP